MNHSQADAKRKERRDRVEDAMMRAPKEIVRRRLKLLPSELDDYVGADEPGEEGNPISGY